MPTALKKLEKDHLTIGATKISIWGPSYFKAHPGLCRTKRLLIVNLLANGNPSTLETQPEEMLGSAISVNPGYVLASLWDVPALLAETHSLELTESKKSSKDQHLPLGIFEASHMQSDETAPLSMLATKAATQGRINIINNITDIPPFRPQSEKGKEGVSLSALVGTDEQINSLGALGLLGLRCSHYELQRCLAGQPLILTPPKILGVRLIGTPPPFISGTDIAHALIDRLSGQYAPYKFIEFFGSGVSKLSFETRKEINHWTDWLDALSLVWPMDQLTESALHLPPGSPKGVMEKIGKALGLWQTDDASSLSFDQEIEINLSSLNPGYPLVLPHTQNIIDKMVDKSLEKIWYAPSTLR